MSQERGRLRRASTARPVRAIAALALIVGLSSGGFAAFAVPAHAAQPAPTLDSPGPAAVDNDPTPTWSFGPAGLSYECAFGAQGAAPTYSPCTTATSFTAAALTTDGDYRFWVREVTVTDDGLPATADYTFDTVAQVTIVAPQTPGNDPTPHWGVQVEPGGSATCSLDAGTATDCTGGYDAPALSTDGGHTLHVDVTDGLGNTGSTDSTYTLDTAAPGVPTVSGSNGTHNTGTVSWSWPLAAGEGSRCTLSAPGGTSGPSSCDSGTFSRAITSEGDYQLTVNVTDDAGNASAEGLSPVYTYDKTPPPAPTFSSTPPGTGTDPNPSWSFSTPGTTTTCQLVGSGSGPQGVTGCVSGSAVGTALTDDSWTLTVTTRDVAGNTSAVTSPAYLLDTTGPDAPVVTGPTGFGNDPTPHFTWLGELPTTAVCRLVRTDAGGTTTGPWLDCTARFFDPALTGDADYRVEARLTDPLGNVGSVGTSGSYQYDSTKPVTPVVSGPPLVGNATAPTFTFTPEVGGSAACRYVQGALQSSWATCSGGSYTPTFPAEGSFTVEVVVTDAAGNASDAGTRDYTLDTTRPAGASITSPPSPSSDRTPSWGLSGDGQSALTCQVLRANLPVSAVASCPSGFDGDLTGQPDGSYLLEVTATDSAGNTTVVTASYVLDTAAPSAPTVTGPPSPGNAFSPSWSFPVQPQTTATCRLVTGASLGTWRDCSGGTFTASSLADGTYTVQVQVTDLAGNDAPLVTSSPYVSDRTAPAAAVVNGPVGPGHLTNPSWSWIGEGGVTATCELDRNAAVTTPVDCSSGIFQPTLSGDASYVVVVVLKDAAGNSSVPTSTQSYDLDTVLPAAAVVSGPSGTSNSAAVSWTWTFEAGASTECQLVRDGTPATWTACTSGQSRTLPGDGVYVLQVRVVDPAGNVGPVASSPAYSYDGTAPVAPSVTAPASPSNSLVPSYTITAEAGTAVQCRLLRAGALVRDWAACTSPYVVDLTGLPDASYVLEARATDAAGNASVSGAALPYLLDTTAPDPPNVSGPSGPATDTTPSFTWTGEAGTTATCRLSRDGVLQGTAAVTCVSPYRPTLVGDGQWVLRVRLTDAAGNRGLAGVSGTYVLDTTPPVKPVVTPPAPLGRDTAPSWSVVVEAGTTSECRLTTAAGTLLPDWASCSLPVTTDLSNRADGTYVLAVRSTDAAGLTSVPGTGSYVLDTTAPAPPVFTALPASPSRNRSATFGFTAEAGAALTCRLSNGSVVVSPDTPCTSPLPVSFTGLADGAYTLSVKATDAAGNTGAAQTAVYVLDTTAPVAPVLVSGPAPTAPDRTPAWSFSSEAGTTLTCRLVGTATGTVVPDTTCSSPFTADLTSRADDTYTFSVRATDDAGNTGAVLSATYVLDATAPTTADVIGPVSPGKTLTPTWQVSSTEGTVQCRLLKGSSIVRDWVGCGPTFSTSLAGFGDGTYTMAARVVDSAGNLSAEVTSRYVLDTTAPAPAMLTTPASPSNDRAPTWTIASPDAGVTAQCQVLGPTGAVVRPFASCPVTAAGAPYSLDLTGAGDGSWTLVVRLTDTAGNTGTDARGTYVLDTTAPRSVLLTAPVSPSSSATPTWQLTGDSDATLECRLTGPGLTGTTFSACAADPSVPGTGSFTADLTTRPDGTYTLSVRSRDAAGNLGPETTSGYVIDRVAPSTPTAPVAPPSPSQQATISWDFTVDSDATALCTLSSATAVAASEQVCTSPWTTALDSFGDGDYALSVRAVDAAGNSSTSATAHYVLDRTPPTAPAITNSPGSPGPDLTPTWGLSPSDARDLLECQLLGTPAPLWAPCTDPATFDLGTATSGVYQLQVREIDTAGNVSLVTTAADYVLDLTAPAPPDVFAPDVPRSNSTAPVFHLVRQDGDLDTDHLECTVTRFDGGSSTASPCAFGDATVDLRGLHGDGPVVLTVRGVDALGNVSAPASATYAFDDVRPATPSLLGPDPDAGFSRSVSWTFGGVDDADHFVCELRKSTDHGPLPTATCTSPHALTLPSYGSYTVSVWAVDVAGNLSTTSAASGYTWLAPVPTPATPKAPAPGTDSTPTWTISVAKGYTASCLVSDALGRIVSVGDCSKGSYTVDLSKWPAGSYALSVQLTDVYGNVGEFSQAAAYRFTPKTTKDGHIGQPGSGPGSGPVVPPPPPTGSNPGGKPRPPHRPLPDTGGTVTIPGRSGPTVVISDPTPPRAGSVVRPQAGSGSGAAKNPRKVTPGAAPGSATPLFTPEGIRDTIAQSIRKPTIPLVLLVVVVGFLLLQNQMDRRDPKLASAPVGAEPELEFGPVVARNDAPFGAPGSPGLPPGLQGGAPA